MERPDATLLDMTDKAVLLRLQAGFPLHPRPFRMLADALGLSEQEVMRRVQRLKDDGYIRSVRAVFDVGRVGAVSTLVAARVEPQRIEEVARAVNLHPEVTHNYERAHTYNLWFTIIAQSRERIEQLVAETRGLPGVEQVLELPALQRFKISAVFDARH